MTSVYQYQRDGMLQALRKCIRRHGDAAARQQPLTAGYTNTSGLYSIATRKCDFMENFFFWGEYIGMPFKVAHSAVLHRNRSIHPDESDAAMAESDEQMISEEVLAKAMKYAIRRHPMIRAMIRYRPSGKHRMKLRSEFVFFDVKNDDEAERFMPCIPIITHYSCTLDGKDPNEERDLVERVLAQELHACREAPSAWHRALWHLRVHRLHVTSNLSHSSEYVFFTIVYHHAIGDAQSISSLAHELLLCAAEIAAAKGIGSTSSDEIEEKLLKILPIPMYHDEIKLSFKNRMGSVPLYVRKTLKLAVDGLKVAKGLVRPSKSQTLLKMLFEQVEKLPQTPYYPDQKVHTILFTEEETTAIVMASKQHKVTVTGMLESAAMMALMDTFRLYSIRHGYHLPKQVLEEAKLPLEKQTSMRSSCVVSTRQCRAKNAVSETLLNGAFAMHHYLHMPHAFGVLGRLDSSAQEQEELRYQYFWNMARSASSELREIAQSGECLKVINLVNSSKKVVSMHTILEQGLKRPAVVLSPTQVSNVGVVPFVLQCYGFGWDLNHMSFITSDVCQIYKCVFHSACTANGRLSLGVTPYELLDSNSSEFGNTYALATREILGTMCRFSKLKVTSSNS